MSHNLIGNYQPMRTSLFTCCACPHGRTLVPTATSRNPVRCLSWRQVPTVVSRHLLAYVCLSFLLEHHGLWRTCLTYIWCVSEMCLSVWWRKYRQIWSLDRWGNGVGVRPPCHPASKWMGRTQGRIHYLQNIGAGVK